MPPEASAIATLGWLARAKGILSQSGDRSAAEDWLAANGAPAPRAAKPPRCPRA